ncbi:MAG: hypothetical protein M1594_01850 [Candidatus Marsarchaeota archaeon]|nr:hypothetical protein [Candidatus Marsarchaeota archaeon]
MKVYFVKLKVPLSEALEKLKSFHAIVVKPELGYSEKLLDYSYFIAFKCFRKKTHAKTLEMEWLKTLACTKSIERAVEFTKPEKKACIASPVKINKSVLNLIGVSYKGKKNLEKLAKVYGVKTDKKKVERAVEQKICISGMVD